MRLASAALTADELEEVRVLFNTMPPAELRRRRAKAEVMPPLPSEQEKALILRRVPEKKKQPEAPPWQPLLCWNRESLKGTALLFSTPTSSPTAVLFMMALQSPHLVTFMRLRRRCPTTRSPGAALGLRCEDFGTAADVRYAYDFDALWGDYVLASQLPFATEGVKVVSGMRFLGTTRVASDARSVPFAEWLDELPLQKAPRKADKDPETGSQGTALTPYQEMLLKHGWLADDIEEARLKQDKEKENKKGGGGGGGVRRPRLPLTDEEIDAAIARIEGELEGLAGEDEGEEAAEHFRSYPVNVSEAKSGLDWKWCDGFRGKAESEDAEDFCTVAGQPKTVSFKSETHGGDRNAAALADEWVKRMTAAFLFWHAQPSTVLTGDVEDHMKSYTESDAFGELARTAAHAATQKRIADIRAIFGAGGGGGSTAVPRKRRRADVSSSSDGPSQGAASSPSRRSD